jgi:F0F1-type ATP synthase assembly protein I
MSAALWELRGGLIWAVIQCKPWGLMLGMILGMILGTILGTILGMILGMMRGLIG